jgi:hypothetical protein
MPCLDDLAPRHGIAPMHGRLFQHTPEVHFIEAPVFHSLQQMRAELQFPVPPRRPLTFDHVRLTSPRPLIPERLATCYVLGWYGA